MKREAAEPAMIRKLVAELEGAAAVRRRRNAARALGQLGAAAHREVYDLARSAVEDSDASVRRESARSLSRLGPVAMVAIPRLVLALRDPSAPVRIEAANTLAAIWNAMAESARGEALGRR